MLGDRGNLRALRRAVVMLVRLRRYESMCVQAALRRLRTSSIAPLLHGTQPLGHGSAAH